MNNFKFLKDKRKNITEVSLVCALTMSMVLSSCSANFVNNNITSETSEISQDSATTTSEIVVSNNNEQKETTLPTKNTNPTGYADYLDVPMPCNNFINLTTATYNGNQINIFTEKGWRRLDMLGFDNQALLENIRNAIGDDTITYYNLDYLQGAAEYLKTFDPSYEDFLGYFDEDVYRFSLEVARYILEENDLRMWIDEIPAEFFEQNYSDRMQVEVEDDEEKMDYYYSFTDYFYEENISEFYQIKGSSDEQLYKDTIEEFFFDSAILYNKCRASMIYSFDDKFDTSTPYYENVKQIKNTEGKNVLIPTEEQYNKIFDDFELILGYNLDPLCDGPETREDLENAGINLQELDEAAKLIGGITFEQKSEDLGESRSRSN